MRSDEERLVITVDANSRVLWEAARRVQTAWGAPSRDRRPADRRQVYFRADRSVPYGFV